MCTRNVRRKCWAALCGLVLIAGDYGSIGASKSKSKSGRDDGRRIAARQVINRANALRAELTRRDRRDRPPYTDHRHHMYAHVQAGKQKWELIGSPSGVFPVIVHEQDRKVNFNLYIPTTPLGQAAEITVIDEGFVAPFHGLVGREASERDQRVRAPSQGKGKSKSKAKGKGKRGPPHQKHIPRKKNIAVAAGPNGRISFSFHYGTQLHAQRIEIRTPQQRVFFNLHHHPPGFDGY